MSRRVDGQVWVFSITVDPPNLAAGLQAEVTATGVPADLKATDVCIGLQPPAAFIAAGLGIVGARVHAAGDLRVTVVNNTAGAVDGGALVHAAGVVGNESPI